MTRRLIAVFKTRNNRFKRLGNSPLPSFLCIESAIWRQKSVLIKRAAKTVILHRCDVFLYTILQWM